MDCSWYLQKLLVKNRIRNIDRAGALAVIADVDYTDYSELSRITSDDSGVLIAVPHHGHYIFSIINLAEQLRHHRQVLVFYGQAKTHQGNEVFDALHSVIWGDGQGVEVIHDTRQGMAKAIRGLKNGAAVVIMPDVFQREEDTLIIPFCGRPMNVMLGTAMLARKTGAWILPAVACQHGPAMGFKTWFGKRIDHAAHEGDVSSVATRIRDYQATRALFGEYESVMSSELMYWQFVRQFLSQQSLYMPVDRHELPSLARVLAADPSLLPPAQVLDLRNQ